MLEIEDEAYLSIEMENIDKYTMLQLQKEYGNTLVRMYYRSKFDYNYIEYFEPKIYDAFICCLDFSGRKFTLLKALKEYTQNKNVNYLERCLSKLTEKEIKDYAQKFLFKIKE